MKILLDECLPLDLRNNFASHETHTAQWAGLKGEKNGALLAAAIEAGYEVMITSDRSIPYQQDLSGLAIAVLVLRAETNKMDDLLPLVEAAIEALRSIQPGQVVEIR